MNLLHRLAIGIWFDFFKVNYEDLVNKKPFNKLQKVIT